MIRSAVRLAPAALIALAPANVAAAELFQGRCHMNECSWFSVEERDIVGSTADGALFKTVMKTWVSEHPDGDYEKKRPRRGVGTSVSYFFCSKSRPAVVWESQPGIWEADFLTPGSPLGPSGAAEAATVEYFVVCHGLSPEGGFAEMGKRFGYPPAESAPEPRKLARPEDLLARP